MLPWHVYCFRPIYGNKLHKDTVVRLAITVWEGRVSPVFDTARIVMVTDIESGEARDRHVETLPDGSPSQKVARLRELGVETLVCGAISGPFASLLSSSGIRLIPFVSGDVDEVLQAVVAKGVPPRTFSMPGCGRGQRFRGRHGNCCVKPQCSSRDTNLDKGQH
jgi:predicted Fe-Mo cluster-binding NifX family protein